MFRMSEIHISDVLLPTVSSALCFPTQLWASPLLLVSPKGNDGFEKKPPFLLEVCPLAWVSYMGGENSVVEGLNSRL